MLVRRAARTVRGLLKRGSGRDGQRESLTRATTPVIESMESRLLSSSSDVGEAVVAMSDGSIVVGGTFDFDITLVRYDANGVRQSAVSSGKSGLIDEMVLDASGRIVAAGIVNSQFA